MNEDWFIQHLTDYAADTLPARSVEDHFLIYQAAKMRESETWTDVLQFSGRGPRGSAHPGRSEGGSRAIGRADTLSGEIG